MVKPVLYNDRVYTAVQIDDRDSTSMAILKSPANPFEPWTRFDTNDLGSSSTKAVRLAGTTLHIVTGQLRYQSFDVSTDALSNYTTGTGGDSVLLETVGSLSLDFVVRPNGDIVVIYEGATDKIMGGDKFRVDYALWNGTSWSVGNALDAAGDIHYGDVSICEGTVSNDVHLMWNRQTSTANDPPAAWSDMQGRTLRANDTLSAVSTQAWNADCDIIKSGHEVFNLDDAGTPTIVRLLTTPTHVIQLKQNTEDASDDISIASATVTPTIAQDVGTSVTHNRGCVPHDLAYDSATGELYHVFAGGGTDGIPLDLYYRVSDDFGSTWGTEVAITTPIYNDIQDLAANIYTRNGEKVLAIIYYDSVVSTYAWGYYDEVLLEGVAPFLPYYGQVNDARKRNTLLRM